MSLYFILLSSITQRFHLIPIFAPTYSFMLTNNDILKKLRVALELRDDDIIKILKLENFEITKTELSAIFRKDDHPNYRPCGDQLLRNFLNGLVTYKRGPMPSDKKAE